MVILHIAKIPYNDYMGVSVATPQHIASQSRYAEIAFLNLSNELFPNLSNQLEYVSPFCLDALPNPFNKPDLVVFHEVYRPEFLKLAKTMRARSIPYIIIPHGSLTKNAQKRKWIKKTIANTLLFNHFVKNAAAIQFLSAQEQQNSIMNKHGFIGTNGFFLPKEIKSSFHSHSIKFLYIGNLAFDIKGIDLMLNAFKASEIELRAANAKLYLYGPDVQTWHADIRKLVFDLRIADLVEVHDKITGAQKIEELLSADIFIQTSRTEGMSMGILEALSYGLPCLVTKGTNFGDIISQDCAGWVAETDAESIAQTIRKAIKEQNSWSKKSKNARRTIQENFLWDSISEKTITNYHSIIS